MEFLERFFETTLRAWYNTLRAGVAAANAKGDQIMATLADLQTSITAINDAITAERAEVQSLLGNLRAEIQALSDQLAAGQLVTQAQLDAAVASADAIVARVREISEPDTAPAPV